MPQPPPRHVAGTSGGQQRRRRAGGPENDAAEWQVPRASRAAPKGPAQRTTPRGNRRVTFASDPLAHTHVKRGGSAKNASIEGGGNLGRPSPFTPLADSDDEEMEAPPPPTTPAPPQQQQGDRANDGEETPRPEASPPPAATDGTPRPPVRRRRRTPQRSTGSIGQTPPPAQQAGPGAPPQTGDRSRPPGEDGMTPGIFDQLSPGDRAARSAAFGWRTASGTSARSPATV